MNGVDQKKRKFLLSLSDELADSEVRHLIFLCKGVVLPREVAEKIQTFPELVEELEKHKKIGAITKDTKDWQVLFDILELIGRKDIIKKLKNQKTGTVDKKAGKSEDSPPSWPFPFFPNNDLGTTQETDINVGSITLKEILQRGEYSDFYRGISNGKRDVMVEVYKVKRSSDMQQSFASQGDIQSRLKHENIVEVLKVFRNKEPPWIVLEWMTHSDLQTFVRSGRAQDLTSGQLIGFALQISKAMCYMADNCFAHCNLKASSIFITGNNIVKVGGFCLARKLQDGNLRELEEDVRLSLRWSALEVIIYRQVNNKSDVWSFGIVLVEMFSRGDIPYQDMETKEIVTALKQRYRHPKPDSCPNGLYKFMMRCWDILEDNRPSFSEIVVYLENYKEDSDCRVSRKRGSRNPLPPDTAEMHEKRATYNRFIVLNGEENVAGPSFVNKTISLFPTDTPEWTKQLQLPRGSLHLTRQIGSGEFGEVWKAELPNGQSVAVKMFIPTRMDSKQFLDEAEMMKKFNHPHLVPLIGVCSDELPILIVTELMPFGNLLDYLRSEAGQAVFTHQLLQYASQVAAAMSHLEQVNCIHRDIAARNVFMRDPNFVKLGDFGLSRTVISSYYLAQTDVRFPARWTAPEAATLQKFSIKSDVWSYGVFLVELVTYGEVPYSDMNSYEVISNVRKGYKHPQPVDTCSDDIYEVMISCWRIKPERRPSFKELIDTVKDLVKLYEKTAASSSESGVQLRVNKNKSGSFDSGKSSL